MPKVERQLAFGNRSVELVKNLTTGRVRLQSRARKSAEQVTHREKVMAMQRWWSLKGERAFLHAAQSWPLGQSVELAEIFGQNVEFASGQSAADDAEINLRSAIKSARGRPISALDIAMRFKNQAEIIKIRLGLQSGWVDAFLNWTADLLVEEHKLGAKKATEIKTYIQYPFLPNF